MARPAPSKPHRSDLRSNTERAAMRAAQDGWTNDGGDMCAEGRIVLNPAEGLPYLVILTRQEGGIIERAFTTMREAEAFVRRNTPAAAAPCATFERPADGPLTDTSST